MDPDEALKWCLESISRQDFATAIAHFQSLDRWLQSGGFLKAGEYGIWIEFLEVNGSLSPGGQLNLIIRVGRGT